MKAKLVKESLIYYNLNENMQQARAILKKANRTEDDPQFQRLKQLLLDDNKIGYIGKFTKWLIKDGEEWDSLMEVYDLAKEYPHAIPAIDTFNKLEDLYDFMQEGQNANKSNKAIKEIKKRLRHFNLKPEEENKLANLLRLNLQYIEGIIDFYGNKGSRYNSFEELYKATEQKIDNLSGGWSSEGVKAKLKSKNAQFETHIDNSDVLSIRVLDYKTSCDIGSADWCISTSESQWNSYVDVFKAQYFVYNFTVPQSDNRSMIGLTVSRAGEITAAHWRDDGNNKIDGQTPKEYAINLMA